MAAVLTGALMLEQLGHAGAARDLERAVRDTLAAGVRPADLGGTANTATVTGEVGRRL
jgi:isocitrate/isopropylmalate dehydrogenase